MKVLVTGAAGFIGSHVARSLLARGHSVLGLDNLNPYYDPTLKQARVDWIRSDFPEFCFEKLDLGDRVGIEELFAAHSFDRVVHLAAQAGVQYSITNPHAYTEANVTGFLNILEACRHAEVEHLVFASTSSIYGGNTEMPFSEHHTASHPLTIYAATKRANELMGHSYAHLYGLPATGLRFFTVYGPWGRPDMALFIFTERILRGEPIPVHNFGNHKRDFTYVDDIVKGVVRILDHPPTAPTAATQRSPAASPDGPFRLFNIGSGSPVALEDYIAALEKHLGLKAVRDYLPQQPGDVPETFADITELEAVTGYRPTTPVDVGVGRFVEWYREYYRR